MKDGDGAGTGQSTDPIPMNSGALALILGRMLSNPKAGPVIGRVVSQAVQGGDGPLRHAAPGGVARDPPSPGVPAGQGNPESVP